MKRILIVAVIMAMLMSGCSVMMSTMEQGATQPTVEEMLAQALQLSNAGNYEEAILLYEAIIEIEPNNYEAGYGLGHAYRSVGRTMDAISILKKAAKLSTDDKRAMYELGYAYLDAGEYSNARDAVRMEKTGDDMAPEVAILLVLSYAAEGSYDRQLDDEKRKLLDAQLERYSGRVMSDKNAAAMATVLMTVAEKAAAMVPAQSQSEGDAPPLVEIGAESREEKGPEVMVDGA